MKKIPGGIIILHICTINDDHMMYGSWVMERNQALCHLDHFLPFYPPNNWENQNFEKMKKNTWRYPFTLWCTTNDNHTL